MRRVVESTAAKQRRAEALAWVRARAPGEEVLVVGASLEAANRIVRDAVRDDPNAALFGWHRLTLGSLAGRLALPELAARGLAPVGGVAREAVCARAVHELSREGELGRFAPVAQRPGLPRALAHTLAEVALAGVKPGDLAEQAPDVDHVFDAFRGALDAAGLVDRAQLLSAAVARARAGEHPLLDRAVVFVDVPVHVALERELVAALVARAPDALALVPHGDARARAALAEALDASPESLEPDSNSVLSTLQQRLFAAGSTQGTAADASGHTLPSTDVVVFSAPGEARECVEIARLALADAARGVPFDRMAVLLRSPGQYRAHVEETFRRARIPVAFTRGTRRPDPSGRALLALLACRAERYSARAFSEYLSLGVVPDANEKGAPPAAGDAKQTWLAPDEDVLPYAPEEPEPEPTDAELLAETTDTAPVVAGTLRAPRRWENLLVDAAVIGGLDRWERRLDGLERSLGLEREVLEDPDSPRGRSIDRRLGDLASLRAFALPLLAELESLPERAHWGEWIEHLSRLAGRALRQSERVRQVLGELAPMAPIGPVDLSEVRLVLERRLTDLLVRPSTVTAGKVLVADVDEARGLDFDVVFAPGLAEKMFPHGVDEDPVLLDELRAELDLGLPTNDERVEAERLALRLVVGAATDKLVVSWPRVDAERSRQRVPSFYGLELLHAVEGALPGFVRLSEVAAEHGGATTRLGWPAPRDPAEAVDDAEYDLAVLGRLSDASDDVRRGAARYMLGANEHLARALQFRGRRWTVRAWKEDDGLVKPSERVLEKLAAHRIAARPYSATALEKFAACPYRFFLHTVMRIQAREVPEAIEEIDPLSRGKLVHEVQYAVLAQLRDEDALPVDSDARLERAREILDEVMTRLSRQYEEDLAPAIARVWDDGIAAIHGDLREWLLRMTRDGRGWVPLHFELAFAMPRHEERDPASRREPVKLACGVSLRGSIDLVEGNDGVLRATDYKTGKAWVKSGVVVDGGKVLQPVLYAQALEAVFPKRRVGYGRLYYCTSRGGFQERNVNMDETARRAAAHVAKLVDDAVKNGFLPAAPEEKACRWCDYQEVCGPYEETRTTIKDQTKLVALTGLRRMD